MSTKKKTPFEIIGGRETIKKVTKVFYDKVYQDPWLGQYFKKISQEHIENQQTDFMQSVLWGPRVYSGRTPGDAHEHMVISDELFDHRNRLLSEAMNEVGMSSEAQELWLNIDEAFRLVLVKDTSKAKKRHDGDTILNFTKN